MTTTPLQHNSLDRFLTALRNSPLQRASVGGMVGGVCLAVAEQTGVSVRVVRIATVIVGVLGVGVPTYLLAWLLLPDTRGSIHLERALRGGRAGSILLLVASVFALVPGPHAHPVTSWAFVAALVAGLSFAGSRRAGRPSASGPYPTWPPQPSGPTDPTDPTDPAGPQDRPAA